MIEKLPTTSAAETGPEKSSEVPLAIVLEGVSEKWQMNVLQILGRPVSVNVNIDGHGTIEAAAFMLSQAQARHLAAQIAELLSPENEDRLHGAGPTATILIPGALLPSAAGGVPRG